MSRSLKKAPYVEEKLYSRIRDSTGLGALEEGLISS